MEFNFNIADIFNQPIVEINRDLIPPGFRGDRRTLWNTVNKVSEVVNAIGQASAAAQGLPKPITSSERLKNSEHKLYLLIDQHANAGKGAVTGMLRTGAKGLYVFDKEGQHYQVSPPCILDFYIHESSQRKGLGRQLFQHMLHKEQVDPGKMAIDRPSEKLIRFLNKHYGLNSPMKQMNNYVVYEGFFPKKQTQSFSQETSNNRLGLGRKESANGLQSHSSPFGRYGASRPPTSIRKLLHNDPQDPIATTPPHHSHQSNDQNDNQTRDSPMDHQEYSKQPVPEGMQHNPATQLTHPNPINNHTINQQVLQGHHTRSNQNITPMNRRNQQEYSLQSQMQKRVTNSSPEIPNRNQAMYHQQQYHSNLQSMQSLPHLRAGENSTAGHQFDTEKDPQYNITQNTGFYAPQTEQPQQLQQQVMNSDYSHYQHHQQIQPHVHGNEDQSGGYTHYQESAVTGHYPQAVSNNNLVGMPPQNLQKPVQFAPATTMNQTGYSTQNQSPQDESHYSTMSRSYHNQNNAQQQVHMIPTEPMQYQQISNNDNSAIIGDSNNQNLNQMASQHALPQSPNAQTNSYGDSEKHQMPIISEEQNPVGSNDAQNSNSKQMIPRGADNDYSQSADPVQHQIPTNHQNSQNNAQFSQAEYNQTNHVPQSIGTEMAREVIKKSSAAATNIPPVVKEVAYINPMDSRNMSNPNYISQVQYNPIQKTPVASRTTVPMEEGVLEYGYPPQLNRAQALHFQKSDVMSIN